MELRLKPEEWERICKKYPNTIPVFVIPSHNRGTPAISKNKFLVPPHVTMGEFLLQRFINNANVAVSRNNSAAMLHTHADQLKNKVAEFSKLA